MSWDIPKAFPGIPYKVATQEESQRYRQKYFVEENAIDKAPPLYVGGYQTNPLDVYRFRKVLKENFAPAGLGIKAKIILEELKNCNSCAIHIRRGDLSDKHIVYGNPPQVQYFVQSIKLIESIVGGGNSLKFYIFSDDIDWARKEFVPQIADRDFTICDFHNPSEGYLDLYLMAHAKNIIGSQGSMGTYAKILSFYNPWWILSRYATLMFEFDNAILLSCGNKILTQAPKEPTNLRYKIYLSCYNYLRKKLWRKGLEI